MAHALFIPEVQFRIGCYLNAADVLRSSQVCQSWYAAFGPLVWEDLHIVDNNNPNFNADYEHHTRRRQPRARSIKLFGKRHTRSDTINILREKGSWIRFLTYHDNYLPSQYSFAQSCTHLRSLSVVWPSSLYTQSTNACQTLIDNNRAGLQSLRIHGSNDLPEIQLSVCMRHENLTSLILRQCKILGPHMQAFWQMSDRLETLELDHVELDLSNSKPPPPPPPPLPPLPTTATTTSTPKRFPRLLDLKLNRVVLGEPDDLLDLIVAQCPLLKSLIWSHNDNSFTANVHPNPWLDNKFLDYYLTSKTWPDLDSLAICFLGKDLYPKILQGAHKPFKKIEMNVDIVSQDTFNLLQQYHFATLRKIDLTCPANDTSQWILDILASCSVLEEIKACLLRVSTIIEDGRPWVCHRLEEFQVIIDLWTHEGTPLRQFTQEEGGDLSRLVYSRLAALKNLRVIDLRSQHKHYWLICQWPLPLQLDMGMDLLSGLTKLEEVYFTKPQTMIGKDVLWIVEHWKNLELLYGDRLNSKWDPSLVGLDGKYALDYELSQILNKHGVRTPGSVFPVGYLDEEKKQVAKS
ncbi:hypothetical protein BGZ65_004718 [Modicella reniformis]|uniref:F-box domain-containing protein n=1 Tax=Modicella reniformis TaxID=1440133 RepID=A0A9P6M8U7_9FUNG|nr:hypothetical protein BGZ65_004718 [Modicella reniformis]